MTLLIQRIKLWFIQINTNISEIGLSVTLKIAPIFCANLFTILPLSISVFIMSDRYFFNSFPQEDSTFKEVNQGEVLQLIEHYVDKILTNCGGRDGDERGDLYVGDAGIAFMFLQMHKNPELRKKYPCLEHARSLIDSAKEKGKRYSKKADERCAFLLG